MKTYITPNTEYTTFINGGILCHSQDGTPLVSGGNPGDKTPGTGNAAPKRVVF